MHIASLFILNKFNNSNTLNRAMLPLLSELNTHTTLFVYCFINCICSPEIDIPNKATTFFIPL